MRIDDNDAEIGDDNTIVGDVSIRRMGDGNTVVGATNDQGDTVLNRGGTAIGRGARADSTSVAIGAEAGAGDGALLTLLAELESELRAQGSTETAEQAREVAEAVRTGAVSKARQAWAAVKMLTTAGEFSMLIAQITPLIHHL